MWPLRTIRNLSIYPFAAVKDGGQVVTWGDPKSVADSQAVADRLASGVTSIHSTDCAFAAIKNGGEVVTWGRADLGGDSGTVADRLASGITSMYSTNAAFAALKQEVKL